MKRTDLFFAAILVPLDYLMLLVAGWSAYQVRFHQVTELLPVVSTLSLSEYMRLAALVALGWLGFLALAGVFAVRRRRLSAELGRVFFGASTAVLFIIVLIFFRREFFTSRFIVLASWILSVVYLWFMHIVVRSIQRALLRRGMGAKQVVVVGQDQITDDLVRLFRSQPTLGLRVVQQLPEVNQSTLRTLQDLLRTGQVDEVLQGDPHLPKTQTLQLLDLCHEHNVVFKYAADVFATQASHVDIDDLGGFPIIEIKRTPLDGWGRIFKRAVDVVGSAAGLIITVIPGLIVAAVIKLDSAGPVFVQLDRVGQGQRRFKLWKFRSMIRDAHGLKSQLMEHNERADGPLFKMKNDPRITRVGRFIRKTSLDEIPQLWNVFIGDMSLVGPRPHEPEEVARYEKSHKKLLAIKPGITGMAQVSGRSNLTFEEEVRLDTYYIEHWSLSLDLTVLVRTPLAVLRLQTAA